MINAKEKVERLGNINLHCVSDGDISSLARIIENLDSGIFLANENSMVDTYRIDSFDNGLVGSQTVDLELRVGNPDVLDLIELMQSKKDVTFLPGTLLRDYGGYALAVMPVIQNGKITQERVKQTGIAYVDDYAALKQRLSPGSSDEQIQEVVRQETMLKRKNSLKSISVNGLDVLPVICNELTLIPDLYKGKLLDVVLHSCENLYATNEQRMAAYQKIFGKMNACGQLSDSVVIASVEGGENPHKGLMVYENGLVRSLN